MNFRLPCAPLLVCAALGFPLVAFADTPREQLAKLEKDPAARGAAELVVKARAAFTRADRLRGVGDAVRAKLVESTAETWTNAAQALRDLGDARKRAEATEQKAHDAEESLSRARAALEASFAREQSLTEQTSRPVAPAGKSADAKTAAAPKGGAVPKAKPKPKTGGQP